MQAYQENISAKVSGVLSPVLGVQVTVTDTATGNPAALYSDNGVTSIAQPLVTDEIGYFGFYAANGDYELTFASAQVRVDPRFVQLYDPDDDAPLTQAQAAASSGASKIGIGAETVENALNALQLADYTALRAYTGPRKSVYVTGYLVTSAPSGIAGMFIRDDSDTSTADNGGTVIVAGNGKRWKRKIDGALNVLWFGADPSYAVDSTAAIQAAIVTGSWNGTKVWIPKGTYQIAGTLCLGDYNGSTYNSVHLEGESVFGTVLQRKAGTGTGPVLQVSGFHHVVENLGFLSEISSGAYSASVGLMVCGYPQTGITQSTKHCRFSNLRLNQFGNAVQIGNYDVDGKDPDIETNQFDNIKILYANTGLYINGQNILHNALRGWHITDCRDYLAHQKRGGDMFFERSYLGGMYDKLTNSFNPSTTYKVLLEAGIGGLKMCRSECYASASGNATPRYAFAVISSSATVIKVTDTVFTTRDNSNSEPSILLRGQGTAGNVSVVATLSDNEYDGYVEIDTMDVFDIGSTCKGTGTGVVNGRKLSANQKAQNFRDLFLDSNQTMELPGVKFKRNSTVPITIERSAVANTSEWLGPQFYDENGFYWGRVGMRVANATTGSETSLMLFGSRNNGSFNQIGVTYASASPTKGVWTAADEVRNSAPAVGSPKSWLNTATGGASSTTRADATAISAGVYAKWSTGTTVWECTTAGTTTTGAPDITGKVVGNTVTDGTVVWTMRATTQANFVSTGNL
jgi:hypothetical protein